MAQPEFDHLVNFPNDLVDSPVGKWLGIPRIAAFHAINTERAYQDEQKGNAARHAGFEPGVQHPAETLTYIRKCLRDAEEAAYRGSSGAKECLQFVRKIAALAVFIMEQHGAPVRE